MNVFITGASSGIGEGLAKHYASGGCHIGLVARRREMLESLATDLRMRGAEPHIYAGDVVDTAFMARSAQDFARAAGSVDLVVANAGIGVPGTAIGEGKSEDIAHLMRVNVIGVTNTIVPFVPILVAQKSGVLSAVSSMAGHRALPGRTAYSASKAAVLVFMDGLRMELEDSGVHAMTFCPGFVRTPLTATNQGMMFVISVDDAVRAMVDAVSARLDTVTFP
ncbi:MAG TPA: SDR family NAD(P)-dependent oxidoreductase, partial [Myxococcota bacterium]